MGFLKNIIATEANKASGSKNAIKPINKTAAQAASVLSIAQDVFNKVTGGTTRKPSTPERKPAAQTTATKQPAQPSLPPYQPPDTDIVTWSGNGGISFFVKPNRIQGVSELNIEAGANVEEKEENDEKFAKRKTNGSIQISMRAYLNAYLGAEVQEIAARAIDAARKGESGYFYTYGKKMFSSQFMMADAKASNILMSGTGSWVSCELDLTLKQSSKADGSVTPTGGGKTGSGGQKSYRVQMPGKNEQKVSAGSVQEAVVKACGTDYVGYVTVDGEGYYVFRGVITSARTGTGGKEAEKAADAIKTTNDAKKQSISILENSLRSSNKTGEKRPQKGFA